MANFDVAIKKDELVKGGCNIPNGYVRLTEVLGSLPAYADDAAAKADGLKKCDVYIKTSTGAITAIQA